MAVVSAAGLLTSTYAASANNLPSDYASPSSQFETLVEASPEMVVANPDGKATLIAVVDYQDYAMHMMREKLSAFTKDNPDIKIVVKPWASGGPLSRFSAKAAYAAARQGKLPAFHAAMLSELGPHTWYSLRDVAPTFGLDWKRFERDFSDSKTDQQVDADARSVTELKITLSPAFIAGGQVFNEPWNKVNLAKIADAARRPATTGATAMREQNSNAQRTH